MLTYEQLRQNEDVNTYIRHADASLAALGYTEHSFAHVTRVAETAAAILRTLDYAGADGGAGADCRLSPRHRQSGQPGWSTPSPGR